MSSEDSSYASSYTSQPVPALYEPTPSAASTQNFDRLRLQNLSYYYPNSNIDSFPSCLNPTECSNAIILSQNNTVATCKSSAKSDAFSVSSNKPIPPSCAIYYYEVTILCDGVDGHIGLGFGPAECHTFLPGWSAKSIGYHADDGFVFLTTHQRYGSGYKCGDIIGCGINLMTNLFFFTQNGLFYGYYPDTFVNRDSGNLHILVGMQSMRESISVNFGQEKFVFDLKSFIQREQSKLMKKITQKNPVNVNTICKMVVEYLVYNGYYKTAVEFGSLVSLDIEFDSSLFIFSQELKELILGGDMISAIAKCEDRFPQIFDSHPFVFFRMKVQHFVELVMFHHRHLCPSDTITSFIYNNDDPLDTHDIDVELSEESHDVKAAVNLIIFSTELYKLCNQLFPVDSGAYRENENLLLKAVSLIEFSDPWVSEYGKVLMNVSKRAELFALINSIILESFGSQKIPSIEVARNQLNKCIELTRKLKIYESFIIPFL